MSKPIDWSRIKHFRPYEFECRCGCGLNNISEELVGILDAVRAGIGRPIKINSACRCEAHNRAVGGERNSAHMHGWAVDIAVPDSAYRYLLIKTLLTLGITRLGIYKDFVHADVAHDDRDDHVTWVGK